MRPLLSLSIVLIETFAALTLMGCGSSGSPVVLQLDPTPHPLIDNLLIARSPRGGTAPMGGAVGRFTLRGRCLLLDTDGTPRTPIFPGSVTVRADGLIIAGRFVAYGSLQSLPMIGPPMQVERMDNAACPRESLFVRSLGD